MLVITLRISNINCYDTRTAKKGKGYDLVGFMVFNATFNNISVISWHVSFIGGGNRRKTQTCRKSLTNCITYACSTPRPERESNPQYQW